MREKRRERQKWVGKGERKKRRERERSSVEIFPRFCAPPLPSSPSVRSNLKIEAVAKEVFFCVCALKRKKESSKKKQKGEQVPDTTGLFPF